MTTTAARGGVVLLHGHGRLGASMRPMARALRRAGYATLTPGYRYRQPMARIVADLTPAIRAFAEGVEGPVHLVTHSLGGLVARALIAVGGVPSVERLIMLGPPNGGSELADLLFRARLGRLVLGRIGGHLRTVRTTDDEALLGATVCEIGVVAGDRALDPFLSRLLPRPNDGKVSVAATRLDGAADHVVLPVSHTLMVYDRRVMHQVLGFLAQGRFIHPDLERSEIEGAT